MSIKVILLTTIGLLLLALGAIGIFIPIWPTTPFVIAAAGCLSCTPALRSRILRIPFFKEHIENYQSRRGLDRKTLISSLIFLWGMLIISMIIIRMPWIMLLLCAIGIAVTTHILWISKPKTTKENNTEKKKNIAAYGEAAFDIIYLCVIIVMGIIILSRAQTGWHILAGSMALVLAAGDAFHLVPRVAATIIGDNERFRFWLGFGKLVASITMTIFYILLWHLGLQLFQADISIYLTILFYGLAILRVALCLFPQNRWTDKDPPLSRAIIRNIPFLLIGVMIVALFGLYAGALPYVRWIWLAVTLSFIFYIPVVIGAGKYPKLGMLMLPKTISYIWIISICFLAQAQ